MRWSETASTNVQDEENWRKGKTNYLLDITEKRINDLLINQIIQLDRKIQAHLTCPSPLDLLSCPTFFSIIVIQTKRKLSKSGGDSKMHQKDIRHFDWTKTCSEVRAQFLWLRWNDEHQIPRTLTAKIVSVITYTVEYFDSQIS